MSKLKDFFLHVMRYSALSTAMAAAKEGDLVGVSARVVGVKQAATGDGSYRLILRDLKNEEFLTLPIADNPRFVEQGRKRFETGELVVAYGTFPQMIPKSEVYDGPGPRMAIEDLRPLTRPTTLLSCTTDEIAKADAQIDELLKAPGGIRKHLLQEAHEILGVDTTHISPRFQLVEEAVILQALSIAQVRPELNSRLSIFLVGGPGTGKSLLGRYAMLYAPIAEQVQACQATIAGLSARVERRQNGWRAEPGVLPLCTGGVCVLEDLHRTDPRLLNQIQATLMPVLEEGKAKPTKAAQAQYAARCGIFVTTNRVSLKDGKKKAGKKLQGPQERAADVVLPMDLVSRFDLVINMGAGDDPVRSSMKIGSQQAFAEHPDGGTEDDGTEAEISPHEERIRKLKVLIGRLKERYEVVDLGQVGPEIESLLLKLGVILREYTASLGEVDEDSFDADGLMRRMANSARKLIGSLARLEGRTVATRQDVQRASEMLIPKMEMTRWMAGSSDRIRTLPDVDTQLELVQDLSEERFRQVMKAFGGRDVRVETLSDHLQCSIKTILRELHKRSINPDGIWYHIPTESEYDYKHRGRKPDLQAELVRPPPDPDSLSVAPSTLDPKLYFDDAADKVPTPPKELIDVMKILPEAEDSNRTKVFSFLGPLFLSRAKDHCFADYMHIALTGLHYALQDSGDSIDGIALTEAFFNYLGKCKDPDERARRIAMLLYYSGDRTNFRNLNLDVPEREGWSEEGTRLYYLLRKRFDKLEQESWRLYDEYKKKTRQAPPPRPLYRIPADSPFLERYGI